MDSHIGENIKKYRKKIGFSQEIIAKKLNVHRTLISKWELGIIIPDIYNLINLSNIFNISVEELLDGEIDTNKETLRNEELKLYKNKLTNKFKVFILNIISIFIIVISLITFFVVQDKKVTYYNLIYKNDVFEINNALLLESKNTNFISLGNIVNKLDLKIEKIVLYIENDDYKEYIYTFDDYKNLEYIYLNKKINKKYLNKIYLEIKTDAIDYICKLKIKQIYSN